MAGWNSLHGMRALLAILLLATGIMLWPHGTHATDMAASEARACILRASNAMDNADASAFARLVDVDAILGQAMNVLTRHAQAGADSPLNLPPLLTLFLTRIAAGDQSVRALLLGELRAFVLNGVASGSFAGRPSVNRQSEPQGLLAPLFANMSTGRKEVIEVRQARRTERQGMEQDAWLVPFVVHDHGNGESYTVMGRVTPVDGTPRLTAIDNMEKLLLSILNEQTEI